MMNEALRQRLMVAFLGEAAEHVQTLNEHLLHLERQPDAADAEDRLRSLYRAAHSMKGAARAVGVPPLETLFHRVEDVFSRIQNGEAALDARVVDAVLSAIGLAEQAT